MPTEPFIVKQSKKQQVWEYMRRNRLFRFGDVMTIVEISQNSLYPIVWILLYIGYLKLEGEKERCMIDRRYRLVKDTGVVSPSMSGSVVFDHNTQESFEIKRNNSEKQSSADQKRDGRDGYTS